jgi:uncharacterized protein YjgD (DUF1641 family)
MKDLIENINALSVTYKAENTWVNKKLVPLNIRLVELDKVIDIINRNPANDTIREIITDLENMSNDYVAIGGERCSQYVIPKSDLDAYIQQLEDRIL